MPTIMPATDKLLISFPNGIFLQFVKDWLTIGEFCLLNSANCNHESRHTLAKSVENRLTFTRETNVENSEVILWMENKGILFSNIILKKWSCTKIRSTLTSNSDPTIHFTTHMNFVIGDLALLDIVNHFKDSLTGLCIFAGGMISESTWKVALKSLSKLTSLEVHASDGFTDTCLKVFYESQSSVGRKNFTKLKLVHCNSVSNVGLLRFVKEFPQLNSFSVEELNQVSDVTVIGVSLICKDLQQLSVSGVQNVNIEVAEHIATLGSLTNLNISDTEIDEDGLLLIIKQCVSLQHFDCSHNSAAKHKSTAANTATEYDQMGGVMHPFQPFGGLGGRGGGFGGRGQFVGRGGGRGAGQEVRRHRKKRDALHEAYCSRLIASGFPVNYNLTWLNMSGVDVKGWGEAVNLGVIYPNIRHLDIGECDPDFVQSLGLNQLRQLTYLDISGAQGQEFTNFDIITHNIHLSTLIARDHMGAAVSLTLCSTIASAPGIVSLTTLDLSNRTMLTGNQSLGGGSCFSGVIIASKNLTFLDVKNTEVDDISLHTIMTNASKLTHLDLSGCNSISATALANLVLTFDSSTTINHGKLKEPTIRLTRNEQWNFNEEWM